MTQQKGYATKRLRNNSDDEQLPLRNGSAEAMPEPPSEFREQAAVHLVEEGQQTENSGTEPEENFEQPAASAAVINTVGFHKHHHIQLETQI